MSVFIMQINDQFVINPACVIIDLYYVYTFLYSSINIYHNIILQNNINKEEKLIKIVSSYYF